MLQQHLLSAGYSVFLAVQGGADWLSVITEAVHSSTTLVAIVSGTYGNKKASPFTYQTYLAAHAQQKVIMPVYHSGSFPPQDLQHLMGTMQYVPKAGAMMGRNKTSIDKVAKELIAALESAGVFPSSVSKQASKHLGPSGGVGSISGAAVGAPAGTHRVDWGDLCDITAEGIAELKAASLTPATGQALQAIGYTEPGDLQVLLDHQLQSLCLGLPPIQAAKVQKLAAGGGGCSAASARPMSARMQAVRQHQLLSNADFNAISKMKSCAYSFEVKQLCNGCGGISGLTALLSGHDVSAAHQAAWALRNLAADGESFCAKVAAVGAIEPLVALLKSSSTGVQEQAAWALKYLAAGSTELRRKVVDAGGIEPLVALLKSLSAGVQEQAAGAVGNLAAGGCFYHKEDYIVAVADAIEPLVALLKSSSAGIQEQAAGALGLLVDDNPRFMEKVAAAGGIEPLVALLKSSSAGMQEQAARALCYLTGGENSCFQLEELREKVAAAGASKLLVALLKSSSAGVQMMAASVLHNLAASRYNFEAPAEVAAAGAIKPLVALLKSSSAGVQHAAALALQRLYECAKCRDKVAAAKWAAGVM